MAILAVRLVISGRVQGVGFRAWLEREAQWRALRGWVRNRSNGSVEALLIGEENEVAAMIEACARGPALARVDRVTQSAAADDGSPDFRARPTA